MQTTSLSPSAGREGEPLLIDGSHGEGGGQIVRSAVSLAAITGRSISLVNIRAGREKPGLAAQHLTSVRAAAALCAARLEGDGLGAQALLFAPQRRVEGGRYRFDVAAAREGRSAGATTLVLQTVLLPLAFAPEPSTVVIEGGTHNPMSPPFDYVRDVWLPALQRMGLRAEIALEAWGFYPAGGGRIRISIDGCRSLPGGRLKALDLRERGPLVAVRGRAVAAKLPAHIAARMQARALGVLASLPAPAQIEAELVDAACPGAGLFLNAMYANVSAGFSALGKPGRPAESVAEEAALALITHHAAGAALDAHLGDQLLLPAALAGGESHFTTHRLTRHLRTNAWLIERFGLAEISVAERGDRTGEVHVRPGPAR